MRFCDLFISYKIGLKGIRSTVPLTKYPFYRKLFLAILLASVIVALLFALFDMTLGFKISFAIGIASIIVFLIVDSRKKNLETMLNNHYKPYSQKRMDMVVDVLKEYNIDIHNISIIDSLIEEAKQAQINCDYITPLKKPIKVLGATIIPVIAFVAQSIGDAVTQEELIILAIQAIIAILLVFSLVFLLTPIIKDIAYLDYNKYNEFIYDMRQLKLFYSEDEPNVSN